MLPDLSFAALPECGTPGIFLPCEEGKLAFHVAEDLYLVEVVTADGAEAKEGEAGNSCLLHWKLRPCRSCACARG